MKAIVTVVGTDRVGIIASVSALLAARGVNSLDVSQTILDRYFTMMMLADTSGASESFAELADALEREGTALGLSIRIQREDIFEAMHRI
ncbi:MAG: ACT domain-containing protein [Oscillospiraceae bacterium]|jgi:ACT domain-containing protein|nr:ACT domain-containing protein [Oscillospiraceae bacterium]